jgi:biotin synthase-related radical SAM superfamily protein
MVKKIRLSIGTAIELGLESGALDPNFTTAFLMTYRREKCDANCAFCPQAKDSSSASDRLSRISWPDYDFDEVLKKWPQSSSFRRICIQTINYPNVVDDTVSVASSLRGITGLPISVAIHPIDLKEMRRLKESGITNIGIALDASTATLFEEIKGAKRGMEYRWNSHIQGLENAKIIFGKGNVTTHLIIGLGETEKEAADFIFQMHDMGIGVGLFAFTNIKGTTLERMRLPDLSSYRRIQIVRHLVSHRFLKPDQIQETSEGRINLAIDMKSMQQLLASGEAFQVTGCRGCNRPYYNERPTGPMYNYPRPLNQIEVADAIRDSELI